MRVRRPAIVTVLLSLALATGLPTAAGASLAQTGGPAGGGATSATSTTGEPGDPDERRRAASDRRQRLEDELGVLERSDAELDAELSRLAGEIEALEASTVEARRAAEQVSARLVELDGEVEEAAVRAEAEHDRLVERAVAAYVEPGPQLAMAVVLTADLSDVGTRKVLVDVVAERDLAVLESAVAARDELTRLEDETRRAEAEVVALRDQREADLAALRSKREEQAVLRDALDRRIAEVHRESDALAAEEAQLARLIAQRQKLVQATAATAPTSTSAAPSTTATTAPTTAPAPGVPTTARPPTTRPPSTAAPTTAPSPPPGTSLAWPTPGPVTSVFGWRWGRAHQGIDIGAPTGQAIVASGSGTVFFAGWMGGYGNLILIDHGNGLVTAYAHQTGFAVPQGASVGRGQVIGYVGSTGNSTGPHLHFEVRRGQVPVDPMPYLR